MSANQNFDAPPSTNGDFVLPNGPIALPNTASPLPAGDGVPAQSLPVAWAPASQPPSAFSRAYDRANRGIGAVLQRVTLPQDDAPADLLGKLVFSTPPWFISLIVHFSFMILLGLLVLGANAVSKKDTGIEVNLSDKNNHDNEIYAEKLGEQLTDPSQTFSRTARSRRTQSLPSHPAICRRSSIR